MGWLDVGDIFQDFPGVIAGFMAVVGRLLNQTDIGQTAQEFALALNSITRSINQTFRTCQDADSMRQLYFTLKKFDGSWDGKNMISEAVLQLQAVKSQAEWNNI